MHQCTLLQGQFAIVEFSDKEAVLKATQEEKQTLQGHKITVRPREHKPFQFHSRGGRGEGKGTSPKSNRYGTVPSELQKAIVLRLSPAEDVSNNVYICVSAAGCIRCNFQRNVIRKAL